MQSVDNDELIALLKFFGGMSLRKSSSRKALLKVARLLKFDTARFQCEEAADGSPSSIERHKHAAIGALINRLLLPGHVSQLYLDRGEDGHNRLNVDDVLRILSSLGTRVALLAINGHRLSRANDLRLATALAQAVGVVRHLDFSRNALKNGDVSMLADALRDNETLEVLRLRANLLGDDAAAALGDALAHNFALVELDLTANRIRASGAERLAGGLQRNRVLRELGVGRNSIRDAGVAALAGAMHRSGCALHALDVSETGCGDVAAEALGAMLRSNLSLRSLAVSGCNVRDRGASALAAALRAAAGNGNRTLRTLLLDGTNVGQRGAADLGAALQQHPCIEKLVMVVPDGATRASIQASLLRNYANNTERQLTLANRAYRSARRHFNDTVIGNSIPPAVINNQNSQKVFLR
jgi:Leucine Rich repeat